MKVASTDTMLSEAIDLVFHQCHKGGDDKSYPFAHQSRYLVGDGLATASRHQGEGIVPFEETIDHLFLHRAEAVIAPILL